jgi:RNA polymerase sigma factor (sigma-70 family)
MLETNVLQATNQSPRDRLAKVLDMAGKGALAFQLSASELADEIEQVPDRSLLPDEALIRNNKRAVLERLINTLPEKEQLIIREYYFNDKPFVAIARENQGMNKSWVSKLHSRALERLRDQIHEVQL